VEYRQEGRSLNRYTNGGRVLAVTGLGDNLQKAVDTAYEAVSDIKWAGAHYRRDIGSKALHQNLLYNP
jgi:phosphoribosylamine--glycine ligase